MLTRYANKLGLQGFQTAIKAPGCGVFQFSSAFSTEASSGSTLLSGKSKPFKITVTETDVDPEFMVTQSPMKIGFLVAPLRRSWVPDALAQLKFSPKRKYSEVAQRILQVALDRAAFMYDALPEQLTIDEVVVNKGFSQKQVRLMGRGRFGVGYKRYSHITMTVKEIDFEKAIDRAPTWSQAQKWRKRQALVERLRSARNDHGDTNEAA
jgi:hypothetical protein